MMWLGFESRSGHVLFRPCYIWWLSAGLCSGCEQHTGTATEEAAKSAERQKKAYDEEARSAVVDAGDRVLVRT